MDNCELEEKASRWDESLRQAVVVWLSKVPRNPGPKAQDQAAGGSLIAGVGYPALARLRPDREQPGLRPTSPLRSRSLTDSKPGRPVCCPGRALKPSTTNGNIKTTQYNGH